MSSHRRIGVIYRKELVEILRDRRTLITMVVVPVVLYPLLMLGFLRAAESEQAQLKAQTYTIEVDDEKTAQQLNQVLQTVRAERAKAADHEISTKPTDPSLQADSLQEGDPSSLHSLQKTDASPQEVNVSLQKTNANDAGFHVRIGSTPTEQLGDAIQLRVMIHHVNPAQPTHPTHAVSSSPLDLAMYDSLQVEVVYNEVNVHSRTAFQQFYTTMQAFREISVRHRVKNLLGSQATANTSTNANVMAANAEAILEPVRIHVSSIATERQRGGWALGQILPAILVLMTITGSIYPAIDLTAGERERGTLETLMATPVPVFELIVGKFLVVASIGMITAFINVTSIGATLQFSGLMQSLTQSMPIKIPVTVLPIVLATMVPLSLLFAAILIAVCSFARTFKEAQNYVMPVILLAMMPAFAMTLPTARLAGVFLVMPVGNMVLLARELFQETYTGSQVAIVLISTSFYAAVAIAIAVRLFGQEAVVFADSGSYKTLLLRRFAKPIPCPSLSQALLVAALLFPISFYMQLLVTGRGSDFMKSLRLLSVLQFVGLFVLLPLCVTLYYRINPVETFKLRWPPMRAWVAAVLLGCSSGLLVQEFLAWQTRWVPMSEVMTEASKQISQQLAAVPWWQVLFFLALVPAVAEEFFFRGFLLSGLSRGMSKSSAIVIAALTFGIYHFMLDKVPVTALLGIALGYLCWQSGSLLPGIVFHALHNGLSIGALPKLLEWLGRPSVGNELSPLPLRVLLPAVGVFVLGLAIAMSIPKRRGTLPTA